MFIGVSDMLNYKQSELGLLLLGLLLFSVPALAEWREIVLPANERLFVDMSSIKRDGSIVRLTFMHDLKSQLSSPIGNRRSHQTFYYTSKMFDAEFNCQSNEFRRKSLTLFSEHAGKGASYKNEGETDWTNIKNWNQATNESFTIACNRK